MTWFDVLLEHWSVLPADVQQKVREYQQLHTAAGQFGKRPLPERAWQIEQELQVEARKLGWRG